LSKINTFSIVASERYALALYELAKEDNDLEKTDQDSRDLLSLYKSSDEVKYFIKNPTQDLKIQLSFVEKISEIMKLSKTLKNFLSILVSKRRIFYIEKIIENFLRLLAKKNGEINATLISSRKLKEEEIKKVSEELSKVSGTSINFKYTVDESLIAGLKIQLGSLMIDTSIKNKLQKYQQIMIGK
tara:strand:- start:480 stop:1037 length:558 start_codon:yes stop_codon:yes gene_type:complete